MTTAFANLVAASLRVGRFTVVDIGCSGGIETVWRLFGDRLRAVGFDASVKECQRLTGEERHPDVHYVAGIAGVPPDHPFALKSTGKPALTRNPWDRLSAQHAFSRRADRLRTASLGEQLEHNAWPMTELADPSTPIVVPEALRAMHIDDIDLLKLDIDGDDFRVLNSFDGELEAFGLLAARLEVNLFGGAGDTVNTFNNTDRFMRDRGFDLVALESRTYSMRALPARFAITIPAQSETGRTLQADAFYVRDLANPEFAAGAAATSGEKLAKLAAILSLWKQPDGAAELLVAFRDRLAPLIDVDAALDLLAAQAQAGVARPLSYRDYMAAFEADAPSFYPEPWTPPPPKTLGRRLAAAWRAFADPDQPTKPGGGASG